MKKFLFWLAFVFCSFQLSFAEEYKELKYQLIQLDLDENCTIEHLAAIGLDFEGAIKQKDEISLIVNDFELEILKKEQFPFTVIQDNLANYFNQRYLERKEKYKEKQLSGSFQFGSMGGFYNLEEIYHNFDQMKIKFPKFVNNADTAGFSIENRPIVSYCFGNDKDPSVPTILFTALHHSREPASASVLIYFLWNLLEMANAEISEAIYLLQNRCIRVMPAVNPDGYFYNQTNYPNGGGMWRKNRRHIDNNIYGVDLNRNYGPNEFWDASNNGSSRNPSQETYRGSAAFSEPETQAVANLFNMHNIDFAINYHTYGNLIIYPWSAFEHETDDSLAYRYISNLLGSKNLYSKGRNLETVGYSTRGDTDDWIYYSDENKKKAFSFTIEVGGRADSFWPLPERILPLCNDVFFTNLQALWSVGANVRLNAIYPENEEKYNTSKLNVHLQNIGLKDEDNEILCQLKSLNSGFIIENSEVVISSLKAFEKFEHSFKIEPQNEFENGCYAEIEVAIIQDGIKRRDTVSVQLFHYKETVLFDNTTLSRSWMLSSWGTEREDDGSIILSDSPYKNYSSNESNFLTYFSPTEIKEQFATLSFETKWQIEDDYDFAVIEGSTDLGISWENLKSQNMLLGSGVRNGMQSSRDYGFSGNTAIWTRQTVDLSKFSGSSIILRFGLLSDKSTQLNGWKLRSIKILEYPSFESLLVGEERVSSATCLFPNPAVNSDFLFLEIDEKIRGDFLRINVINYLGKMVDCFEFSDPSNLLRIPISHLEPGAYFIEILSQNKKSFQKFIKQ